MLGIRLFSELDPKFFGILTGPNARLYVDVIDALEREMPVACPRLLIHSL